MPEKLMRWNGSAWVEVTSLCRTEITKVQGLGRIIVAGFTHLPEIQTELVMGVDIIVKEPSILITNKLTLE